MPGDQVEGRDDIDQVVPIRMQPYGLNGSGSKCATPEHPGGPHHGGDSGERGFSTIPLPSVEDHRD